MVKMIDKVTGLRRPRVLFVSLALVMGMGACDDEKKSEAKAGEPQSVAEGAKAETAPGKMVETGKKRIKAAEKQMEVRDDQIMQAAQGEKVERGQVP
jgi:hypothetical protein